MKTFKKYILLAGRVAGVEEHLPSKREALNSNHRPPKTKSPLLFKKYIFPLWEKRRL
jgi:hypothetical protein